MAPCASRATMASTTLQMATVFEPSVFISRCAASVSAVSRMGFRKGDFLATSLPLLDEHILLEYACFRMGVIHAPLDLRLEPAEVIRCLGLIRAKGYFFRGKPPRADFAALAAAGRGQCAFIEHFVQFSPPAECITYFRACVP